MLRLISLCRHWRSSLRPNTVESNDFLSVCLSVNCLDVHVEKHPDRVALIWERDEPGTEVKVTYRYEHQQTSGRNLLSDKVLISSLYADDAGIFITVLSYGHR